MEKRSEAFKSIMRGLEEAQDYFKGKRKLTTTMVSIAPIPNYNSDEIKRIRKKLQFSQGVFATVLGVSRKTVEAWESGTNTPRGPVKRLLSILDHDKSILMKYIYSREKNDYYIPEKETISNQPLSEQYAFLFVNPRSTEDLKFYKLNFSKYTEEAIAYE